MNDIDTTLLRNKRGQPVKSDPQDYLKLILVKEFKDCALRDAETDWSFFICSRRVDHSFIHYWEKKIDKEFVGFLVKKLGMMIEELTGYDFSFIDSTEFTFWNKNKTEFYTMIRITKDTLYPIGLFFDQSKIPSIAVEGCIVKGSKDLLADAWFDDNDSFEIMFKLGYKPIVKLNKERFRGYYRHKARKLYMNPICMQKYKQRGRGESIFGSLTNQFGDRLKVRLYRTMVVIIGSRVLCYMIRIYMR